VTDAWNAQRLVFQPPVFHPLVDSETGELAVHTHWRSWRPHHDRLWHIFAFAKFADVSIGSHHTRHVLSVVEALPAVNSEASVL
jgi:hypothetical protein